MTERASVAARVAGVVVALGYLLGAVDGPVLGPIGGIGLITMGRALVTPPGSWLLGVGSFGVVAAASGVAALRWGTLGLADLRGAQGVLGPAVLVEPVGLAAACIAAAGGGLLALGLWAVEPGPGGGRTLVWGGELLATGLLLTGLFVGPEVGGFLDLTWWAGGLGLCCAAGVAGSRLLAGARVRLRAGLLAGAAALTLGAAAVVGVST